jgi:hypothetical protein
MFIILCGLFYQWGQGRVLALISIVPKLLLIPAAGIARCVQLSREYELLFPASIMVKISAIGPLSSSRAGQDANQGQHSSFLPHLSVPPPPPLKYRCNVHSHLYGTQNTWQPRRYIVMEDAKSFFLSFYLGPSLLATTADTATMAPTFLFFCS